MNEVEEPAPPGSERVRLARLARDVALATPGVLATDAGPAGLAVTVGGGARIAGVLCASAPGAGYDVTLRLVCALVPLRPLGDAVRAAVTSAARTAELTIHAVSIQIVGVEDSAARS